MPRILNHAVAAYKWSGLGAAVRCSIHFIKCWCERNADSVMSAMIELQSFGREE